jgi:hypothetical protein
MLSTEPAFMQVMAQEEKHRGHGKIKTENGTGREASNRST